jgi:ribonuclease P protein component
MKRSLSKKEILRKKDEIRRVYDRGRSYSVKGMKLFVSTSEEDYSRLLVTLVRAYGNSVERNYARRLGKELFRSHKDTIMSGFDLIFVMYPGAYAFPDRKIQFFDLLRRAHILL